jgi:NAD(P)-dependent dehydrogenase (short-subunit alcohol dehydrogenase family)
VKNKAALYESIRPRYPELRGQVAIVTGSSRGIGKGIALRLAREGMKIVVNARGAGDVHATTAELQDLGAGALAVPADLGQTDQVHRLFEETLSAFGAVDLLVNNAANLKRLHFFEVGEALIDAQLAANVKAPMLCAFRAAEAMREVGGGNIIHISSVGGLRAHWRGLPYDVTKGAIDAMTRAMALELAEFGIRVNAVAPGATRTERTPPAGSERSEAFSARVPLRRFGTPLEIGAAVAFLASPDAAYITGQVIYVDGGITTQLGLREHPL